jgi:hypothetical protein
MALAGADKFLSIALYLTAGEVVKAMTPLQVRSSSRLLCPGHSRQVPKPDLYILATSQNRLFRLSITSSGGRFTLLSAPLSRSRSMLSRVSSLFGGGGSDPRAGIVAVTAAKQQKGTMSRDVFALTSSVIQRWKIAAGGGEQVGPPESGTLLFSCFLD